MNATTDIPKAQDAQEHKVSPRERWRRIIYFFPFRLVLLHFKRNWFLMIFWFLLFGYTLNVIAQKYGVGYQFLYPEYLGKNNQISFIIVGFALGGFILAFNLYTYILHGFRFPFIATLRRPFYKFSVNNSIIPLLFIALYIWQSVHFQRTQELLPASEILLNILAFLLGIFLFLTIAQWYFFSTNRDLKHFLAKKQKLKLQEKAQELQPENDPTKDAEGGPVKTTLGKKSGWYDPGRSSKNWKVVTYLSNPYRIALARTSEHYEPALLQQVLSQNHVNASIFEILIIASFLAIGTLSDYAFFEVPAAASALLFFTMVIMISSAVFSWVKGWTLTFIIGTFVALNFAFENIPFFRLETQAYGLNYATEPADYKTYFDSENTTTDEESTKDLAGMVTILEKWKAKAVAAGRVGNNGKPKLVVLNVSGGGSRSAYWSARVLQQADSLCKGEFWDQTQFISGSSGGMIGTAYMRELKLRQAFGLGEIPSEKDCDAVAKDLLNPILFTMATNDFFVRYRSFSDGDQKYNVDRAYAFERKLHKNTGDLLNKRLGDYSSAEKAAETPLLLLSPSILEDGRRLLIASQPMGFLSQAPTRDGISENVEFLRLFQAQDPLNLKFSSALRMNATFPYILPTTTLPTNPAIEVNDAGIRDNFGLKITLDYLLALREWINENTSGVVIVQIRDTPLKKETKFSQSSLTEKITGPFGAFTQNFTRIQDYNNEQLFQYANSSFEIPIERINFELTTTKKDEIISLSWHLTRKEKMEIGQALRTAKNQDSFKQLIGLFE